MSRGKIAFIADSQLGKRLYGLKDTYNDWLRAFEDCGKHIILETDVRAVILLGDTFDAEAMYPKEIKTAQLTVAKIEDKGIKVYGILGNHDKGQNDISEVVSWLDVCGITSLTAYSPLLIDDTYILGISHQSKQLLAETLATLKPPTEKPEQVILCLHQALKELSLPGQGWEIETEQIPSWFSKVFLGDFHNRCSFKDKNGREFIYPGAIETVSFNQETTPGFIYYHLDTQTITHISTKQRDYLKIEVDKLPSNWEAEVTRIIDKSIMTYGRKPAIQLIYKSTTREDIRIFCESLAMKVVTASIATLSIQEEEAKAAPATKEEVKNLASGYLPKTNLGDLGRLLLEKPELETLRGWQKTKYPAATIDQTKT